MPFAILAILNGWEVVALLAVSLVLFGGRKILNDPGLDFLDSAEEAGRSLGGIFGKPAAQALSTENEVAELYKPAALRENDLPSKGKRPFFKIFDALCEWIRNRLSKLQSRSP